MPLTQTLLLIDAGQSLIKHHPAILRTDDSIKCGLEKAGPKLGIKVHQKLGVKPDEKGIGCYILHIKMFLSNIQTMGGKQARTFTVDERAPPKLQKRLFAYLMKGGNPSELPRQLLRFFEPVDSSGFFALRDTPLPRGFHGVEPQIEKNRQRDVIFLRTPEEFEAKKGEFEELLRDLDHQSHINMKNLEIACDIVRSLFTIFPGERISIDKKFHGWGPDSSSVWIRIHTDGYSPCISLGTDDVGFPNSDISSDPRGILLIYRHFEGELIERLQQHLKTAKQIDDFNRGLVVKP